MFGPCYRLLWLCSDDSNWFSQQCIGKINIRPNVRLCSVPLEWLLGVKDNAKRLFLGGAGPRRCTDHLDFAIFFSAIAASDVYECFPAVKP
jgi:hypothetical protein